MLSTDSNNTWLNRNGMKWKKTQKKVERNGKATRVNTHTHEAMIKRYRKCDVSRESILARCCVTAIVQTRWEAEERNYLWKQVKDVSTVRCSRWDTRRKFHFRLVRWWWWCATWSATMWLTNQFEELLMSLYGDTYAAFISFRPLFFIVHRGLLPSMWWQYHTAPHIRNSKENAINAFFLNLTQHSRLLNRTLGRWGIVDWGIVDCQLRFCRQKSEIAISLFYSFSVRFHCELNAMPSGKTLQENETK